MGYNFEIPSNWKELSEDKYKILYKNAKRLAAMRDKANL